MLFVSRTNIRICRQTHFSVISREEKAYVFAIMDVNKITTVRRIRKKKIHFRWKRTIFTKVRIKSTPLWQNTLRYVTQQVFTTATYFYEVIDWKTNTRRRIEMLRTCECIKHFYRNIRSKLQTNREIFPHQKAFTSLEIPVDFFYIIWLDYIICFHIIC